MSEAVAAIMIDVVNYSLFRPAEAAKLQRMLSRTSDRLLQQRRLRIGPDVELSVTGDCCTIVLLHRVPEAVDLAARWLKLWQAQQAGNSQRASVRVGVDAGAVVVIKRRRTFSFAGPGLNNARRVMDCGGAGDLLVSEAFFGAFLKDAAAPGFEFLRPAGRFEVKHGKEMDLHFFYDPRRGIGNPEPPSNGRVTDERGRRVAEPSFPSLVFLNERQPDCQMPSGRCVALAAHANDLAWGAGGLLLELIHRHHWSVHCHFLTADTQTTLARERDRGAFSRSFDAVSWVSGLYLGPEGVRERIVQGRRMAAKPLAQKLLGEVRASLKWQEIVHCDPDYAVSQSGMPSPEGGFHDSGLRTQFQSLLDRLLHLEKRYAPDLVLAPSIHDNHSDHAAVGEAALQVFKNGETLLFYHLPHAEMPGKPFWPNVFLDLNSPLAASWNSKRRTTAELKTRLFEMTMLHDKGRWRMSPEALRSFMVSFSVRGMCAAGAGRKYFEAFESVIHLK